MAVSRRLNGNLIVTVRITLQPGRDDELIELVDHAPKGTLAGLIREAMRNGAAGRATYETEWSETPLEMDGLGIEL